MNYKILFFIIFSFISMPLVANALEVVVKNNKVLIIENKSSLELTLSNYKLHPKKEEIKASFEALINISIGQFLLSKDKFISSDLEVIQLIKSLERFDEGLFLNKHMTSDYCPVIKETKSIIENPRGPRRPLDLEKPFEATDRGDGIRESRENKMLCESFLKNAVNSFNESVLNPYDSKILEVNSSISGLRHKYAERMGGGAKAVFTTNISFLDLEDKEVMLDNYSCFLGVPETIELDELRGMLPVNGSAPTFETLRSGALDKLKKVYTGNEDKCSTLRTMNKSLKKLISSSQEEADFISIIKKDVICRMYEDRVLNREYLNPAIDLVRSAHTENVGLRASLLTYLRSLSIINSGERSGDEYSNMVWKNLILNLKRNCSLENKDINQTASELASTLDIMFQTLYISDCEEGEASLPDIQCHKKALDYGAFSMKELSRMEGDLSSIKANKNSWRDRFNNCMTYKCDGSHTSYEKVKGSIARCVSGL